MIKSLYFSDFTNGFTVKEVSVVKDALTNGFTVKEVPVVKDARDWFWTRKSTKFSLGEKLNKEFLGVDYFLTARECAEHYLKEAINKEVAAHQEGEAIEKWMDENKGESDEKE
jgi:hypothetical protein